MNSLTKLTIAAAAATLLAGASALADDPQLRQMTDLRQKDMGPERMTERSTTVGVYAGERGLGQRETRTAIHDEDPRPNPGFDLRQDAHSHTHGIYRPE